MNQVGAAQYRANQRGRVVDVARQMVMGTLGIIAGSRELSRLMHEVSDDELDADFQFFVALDFETDHLPLGAVRAEWATEALVEKDEQIRRFEAEARDEAVQHCERLIVRFGVGQGGVEG
jgi:hypothetical protein